MSYVDSSEEGICIHTLSKSLLSSFRLGDAVTITIKSGNASQTISGKIDELENTEDYESYDYDSKGGSDKKTIKTRPGCIKIEVGDDPPEPVDMASMMEADEDDD